MSPDVQDLEPHAPHLDGDLAAFDGAVPGDGAEFEDVLVAAADWSDIAVIDVAMRTSRLEHVTAIGAELGHLRVDDCVFVDCDLSGASLTNISATRVEFSRCRMSGLIASTGSWQDVRFRDCKLDGANFRAAKAERLSFEGCLLTDADFYGAKLERSALLDCDLTRVELSKASLRGARLRGSKLVEIRGAKQLAGAVISSTQAVPLGLLLLGELGVTIGDAE